MKTMLPFLSLLIILSNCGPSNGDSVGEVIDTTLVNYEGLELDKIQLPEGFKIDVFARVSNARSLALSPDGTLFVSNRGEDKVYAIQDTNGDWKADKKYIIASGLTMPNGVAFKDGDLYVAEVSKLWKYANIENQLAAPPAPTLIYDDFPKDRHHGWKYIAFGPDGKLYVPVGAPCNICESQPNLPNSPNVHYAAIMRMNADGSGREVYVDGVRNTVGFTWHPETGEMWFTDNGRDNIGPTQSDTDNAPPCELNRASSMGQHFGYPYCHGGTILDPDFGDGKDCADYVTPAQNLGPHVAPLGLKFGTTSNFPALYENKIFIAEHGSWNRSEKIGYRIMLVTEQNGVGQSYEAFATGWLDDATQNVWGRPVDLVFAADGSMLVSDDFSGTIYRIWYEE
jgi:glucose/arabinose dehydrogenase